MSGAAYKNAGVDIEAGNQLVQNIKPAIAKTQRSGCMGSIGGFGALFDLKGAGYQDPVLVSATDGVGTKLKIAIETGRHDTIGQDLVAMCVNDLVVQGAEALFFLDYFASGKLELENAQDIICGIAKGCEIAGCALIGGETAEMPGMYAAGDYDLAGFAVGAVERDAIIDGTKVVQGDVVIALPSSGLHSNGYSLVRKIVKDAGLAYDAPLPFDGDYADDTNLADALLKPTRIYSKLLFEILKTHPHKIKAMSHITGGGLLENIPRVLPEDMAVELNADNWKMHNLFKWLGSIAELSLEDFALTFNCGIGMVLICAADDAATLLAALQGKGEFPTVVGEIIPRTALQNRLYDVAGEAVGIVNAASNWQTA
jgi:phosphoribosylformylglycinamidine cyclo-ligase